MKSYESNLRLSKSLQSSPLRYVRAFSPRRSRTLLAVATYPRSSIQHHIVHKRPYRTASDHESTIYALSTAPGRAAIAIIRISGPACLKIYEALCPRKPIPKPRQATLRTLFSPVINGAESQVVDPNALILYFPAPETVTGEAVLELHVHGGTAVVKAVLAAIPKSLPAHSHNTIRYAEPGEFTRRAFYHNRLDLLQIEALGDTLAADTEQQRRLAVRGTTNILAQRYEEWRQMLLYARGELEALIDFSEDQHFDESPAQLCSSVAAQVELLRTQLKSNIENASRGELLRNGINIALVGAPNAGKSSLLNQIVGREAAIVSGQAGTTRDVIDVNIDLGGFFCKFGDLAGLREDYVSMGENQIGEIEKEGIRRAKERALSADVVIVVLAPSTEKDLPGQDLKVRVGPEVFEVIKRCDPARQKLVFVLNKIDLFGHETNLARACMNVKSDPELSAYISNFQTAVHTVSCTDALKNGSTDPDPGFIQTFLKDLTQLFAQMTAAAIPDGQTTAANASTWAESLGATVRQRLLLQQCLEHLDTFLAEVSTIKSNGQAHDVEEAETDIVLAAESLRSAADCLAKITGKGESGDIEEVLGVVFEKYDPIDHAMLTVIDRCRRFCVGK